MTIELDLTPELETFARSQAQEQFQGDVAAFINALLRNNMELLEYDADVEQKLLEAIDSPGSEPITEEFWESLRQCARSASQS